MLCILPAQPCVQIRSSPTLSCLESTSTVQFYFLKVWYTQKKKYSTTINNWRSCQASNVDKFWETRIYIQPISIRGTVFFVSSASGFTSVDALCLTVGEMWWWEVLRRPGINETKLLSSHHYLLNHIFISVQSSGHFHLQYYLLYHTFMHISPVSLSMQYTLKICHHTVSPKQHTQLYLDKVSVPTTLNTQYCTILFQISRSMLWEGSRRVSWILCKAIWYTFFLASSVLTFCLGLVILQHSKHRRWY